MGLKPSHGVYRLQALKPGKWPVELRRAYNHRVEALMELPHIDETKHMGAVHQLVRIDALVNGNESMRYLSDGGNVISLEKS